MSSAGFLARLLPTDSAVNRRLSVSRRGGQARLPAEKGTRGTLPRDKGSLAPACWLSQGGSKVEVDRLDPSVTVRSRPKRWGAEGVGRPASGAHKRQAGLCVSDRARGKTPCAAPVAHCGDALGAVSSLSRAA
jgi:hypothetical protein